MISKNDFGDLLVSFTPLQNQCHGKPFQHETAEPPTYTYMDAHPDRLGLEALFEDYLPMPEYQA